MAQIKYPIRRNSTAKPYAPVVPHIAKAADKKEKSAWSYNNAGINQFLGFSGKS